MSLVTPKLGLTKPAGIEQFNLALYNTNLDLVDAGVLSQETERKKVRYAEFVGSNSAMAYPGTAAQWGVGLLVADTPAHNNTFAIPDANDTLKILEAGLYYFEWTLNTVGLPPNGEMFLKNVTTNRFFAQGDLQRHGNWNPTVQGVGYCAVNDIVQFVTLNRSAAVTAATRIKALKVQGS